MNVVSGFFLALFCVMIAGAIAAQFELFSINKKLEEMITIMRKDVRR